MAEETKVKKARKPRAKKAAKKVEVQEPIEQPKIEDIISWDDAKCEEMDTKVHISLKQVRDILKDSMRAASSFNALRAVLMTGAMIGYSVECPQCHKVTKVNPENLVRKGTVTCPECNSSYEQTKCIRGIITAEEEENA